MNEPKRSASAIEAKDVELVAALLGGPREAARSSARAALASTAGLQDLGQCGERELALLLGDVRRARALRAAFALADRRAALERQPLTRLGGSADVAGWATPRLATLEHEELWVLALDGRGGLRGARCAARGGLHGLGARASDVLRIALRLAASAFVLVHNHPSGDSTPSAEDRVFTRRVAEAAEVVGIPLVDHVVVARGGHSSVPAEGAARGPSSAPADGTSA